MNQTTIKFLIIVAFVLFLFLITFAYAGGVQEAEVPVLTPAEVVIDLQTLSVPGFSTTADGTPCVEAGFITQPIPAPGADIPLIICPTTPPALPILTPPATGGTNDDPSPIVIR